MGYNSGMDFYHVINRGVEKRTTFVEDGDYVRFIHDMYLFNDTRNAPNFIVKERQSLRKRDVLVHIHAFCLMPNHYHLLLSPAKEGGLSLFMRKLNMGYAKYFNEKYERSGVLWQGTFRRQQVTRDAHFLNIPYYIHMNPLDMKFPHRRAGNVHDAKGAEDYLLHYRWSSHCDYLNIPNFQSVLYQPELRSLFRSTEKYREELRGIMANPARAGESTMIEPI